MLDMMWCILGLLALVANIDGNTDCTDATLREVKQVLWARCNEENQRRMKELPQKTKEQFVNEGCCVMSDTATCWVDSMRSKCGDEAASQVMKNVIFIDGCASWKYPDSISRCQRLEKYPDSISPSQPLEKYPNSISRPQFSWWLIPIAAILVFVIVASLVFWCLRKRDGHQKVRSVNGRLLQEC